MNKYALLLILVASAFGACHYAIGQKSVQICFTEVPNAEYDICAETGQTIEQCSVKLGPFHVSEQVTLGEYKEFLSAIKQDSSEVFYKTLLPDSSILSPDKLNQYLKEEKYEAFPVVGISWEAALHYCYWKTIGNLKDSLEMGKFVYRLPTSMEWIAGNSIQRRNSGEGFIDANYADWILDTYDESVFQWAKFPGFLKSYLYIHKKDDPPAMRRKSFIGNSFLRQFRYPLEYRMYGYSDRGYEDVSFRIVRVSVDKAIEDGVSQQLLNHWKIELP